MGELDPLIAKVLLQGDSEILEAVHKLGEDFVGVFENIAKVVSGTGNSLENFGNALAGIVGILATATGAMIGFIEVQNSLTQTAGFLAETFGATTAQVEGLEAAFASAGVSTETFERFAQRLATTIAREWPQITAEVRTSATQMSEAQTSVASATLRIADAQTSVKAATERVAEAQIHLQFAAAETASKIQQGFLSIQGATISLASAEQHLSELQGGGKLSAEQKKQLDIANAQLAVKKAHQALYEANLASEKQLAEAQIAQEKAIRGVTAAKEAQQKAELAILEAANARATAEENATKKQLADIPTIVTALKGVEDHNKAIATSINLQEVSVVNLGKAVQKMASDNSGGGQPSPLKTMLELSKLLKTADEELIPEATQLDLVMKLSGQSMRAAAGSGFELLHALKTLGPEGLEAFMKQAEGSYSASAKGKAAVEAFKVAFENLHLQIQLVNRDFAAMATPVVTMFLETLASSIKETDGLLHNIIAAFEELGAKASIAIGVLVTGLENMAASIGIDKWVLLKAAILAVLGIIATFAINLLAIPAAITLIVVGAGLLYEAFFKVGELMKAFPGVFTALGIAVLAVIALFAPWMVVIGLVATGVYLIYENWNKITDAIGKAKDATLNYFGIISKAELDKRNADRETAAAKRTEQEKAAAEKTETEKKLADRKKAEADIPSSAGITSHSDQAGGAGIASHSRDAQAGLQDVAKSATKASSALDKIGDKKYTGLGSSDKYTGGVPEGGWTGLGHEEGGMITGPGTGTSDSIMARLSNGEFVMRAAAVQKYGQGMFERLNRFAQGGPVGDDKDWIDAHFNKAGPFYTGKANVGGTDITALIDSGADVSVFKANQGIILKEAKPTSITGVTGSMQGMLGKTVIALAGVSKYVSAVVAAVKDNLIGESFLDTLSGFKFEGGKFLIKKAAGGAINGPGTGTSDSILARLSNGEFVMKAAAVQAYGSNFMHAINNMSFPGFALGGLVPSPVRLAGGGSVPASSTLNLSIDGRSFGSLRGSQSTIDDLTSFAIGRQTSAAGNNPSWMK